MRLSLKFIFAVLATGAVLHAGSSNLSAGILVTETVVTPIDDPHYEVIFDVILENNTKLTSGDTLSVGPFSYVSPSTGAEIHDIYVPFLGDWGGKFAPSLGGPGQNNVVVFTYIGPDYLNNSGHSINISSSAIGYRFGIHTIDFGPRTPRMDDLLTRTLNTESVTTNPEGEGPPVVTRGTTNPAFAAPEPSTIVMAAAAIPIAWLFRARRRGRTAI